MPPVMTTGAPTANARRVARHRARRTRLGPGHPVDHGFVALQRVVRKLGSRVLDQRSTVARELRHWRDSLLQDLSADATVAQRSAADTLATTRLLLMNFDAFLVAALAKTPGAVSNEMIDRLVTRRMEIANSF